MTTCIQPVSISVSLASPVISAQGMGTLMILSDEPTFAGRVQYYDSLTEFLADSDVNAGTYTVECATAAFTAKNVPARIAIGRIDGLDADMAATISAIMAEDSTGWYGIVHADMDDTANTALAAAVAPLSPYKMCFVQSATAAILVPATTTDIFSVLSALEYENVVTIYGAAATSGGSTTATTWAADRLAINPDTDSSTWRYVTLPGVTASTLNSTEIGSIDAKSGNYYICMCVGNGTDKGVTVNGADIDQVITKHWMTFRLTESFCQVLKDASDQNTKIPYTDAGMAVFGNLALGVFDVGIEAGSIAADPAPTVTLPERSSLSAAVIASKALTFSFTAEPTGAIATVSLSGTLSVAL